MSISEAKTRLFKEVVGLNIACACGVSISDPPVIYLHLNFEEHRKLVAQKILYDGPLYQGYPVEIIVLAPKAWEKKPEQR